MTIVIDLWSIIGQLGQIFVAILVIGLICAIINNVTDSIAEDKRNAEARKRMEADKHPAEESDKIKEAKRAERREKTEDLVAKIIAYAIMFGIAALILSFIAPHFIEGLMR